MKRSLFHDIPAGMADPILGVSEAFKNDPSPTKVNLGVGVYQDADGKIPVLEAVQRAARLWIDQEDTKTYLPIDGLATFNLATQGLLFGDNSPLVSEQRVATVQSVGGSGALKLGADFIRRFFPDSGIFVSDPSWENHRVIFEAAGLTVGTYPYYDPATSGLRATEMLEALRKLKPRSAVLLHACCHNPTGVDIDTTTWSEVVNICAERELLPLIDCAYQGFAEGLQADAKPIRLFAEKGLTFLVANSYAKSFSLYRERVGALSVITESKAEASRVLSQLKRIVRTIYSSPPSYGAQLVAIVLGNPELRQLWEQELDTMRERIQTMREAFCARLAETIPNRDFSFIMKQRGMFSYSGLSTGVIETLREKHHIYALDSGRVCVAAMNHKNIKYICDAIASIISSS